jgi:hypothetical protein
MTTMRDWLKKNTRRIEHYLLWIGLLIIAFHSFLGDFAIKDLIERHMKTDREDFATMKSLQTRISSIEKRHSQFDQVRATGGTVYGIPTKGEKCK